MVAEANLEFFQATQDPSKNRQATHKFPTILETASFLPRSMVLFVGPFFGRYRYIAC